MRKINLLLTLSCIIILSVYCTPKEKNTCREWTFKFTDISLDSVKMHFVSDFKETNEIYCLKQDDDRWTISVPDSIYYDYSFLNINVYRNNKGWCDLVVIDSTKFAKYDVSNALFFSYNNMELNTRFIDEIEGNIYVLTTSADKEFIYGKKLASMHSEVQRNELSHNDAIKTITEYIATTPNSLAIMKNFYLFRYDDIDIDIYKKLYSSFSDEVKNTSAGRSFKIYLDDREAFEAGGKIRVFDLLRCDNQNIEPFIKDDKKYKLVIFSSFGCGPCHEAIPLLKQVHKDLAGKLDILYISVDTKNNAEKWMDILTKYEIPWRSYFSYNIEGGILQKYMLTSVPSMLLVHPDLKFEKIDIRIDSTKNRLYKLLK